MPCLYRKKTNKTKMTTNNQIPKLRFSEFFDAWENKKIEDLLQIKYGKDQKQVICDNGKYPILGTGGEMGRTNSFLFDKPSVLIGRKGTIDKPKYMDTPFWTVDTLFYTDIFQNTFPKWLFYKFETINWYLYNEASGVPSLSGSTIYKIPVNIPSLPEQTKIATFLTAVDEKLTQLKRKKELLSQYKNGIMQQIFSQKLRFKDDNGNDFEDWEEKKLGEVSDVRDGTHDSQKYIEKGYPFITSKNLLKNGNIDFENVSYISEKDYKKINERSKVNINDILFGMIGTIGNPVLVKNDGFAIKNVALIKEKKGLLNIYLIHFLKGGSITQQFFEQNTGGTQKFLSLSVVRSLLINLPCLSEQTKIANFLSALDEKISNAENKITKLEQWKKGLLQSMFC
ncbi:MAG TPA: restriction endonuclease subunit S [Bacteroidales bacterium]|nr:restriction endonuclease subunit S [Bacteroidales bacterium]